MTADAMADRLHAAVAQYEIPTSLTQQQGAGRACVWCGTESARVVLSEAPPLRGCGECYAQRRRLVRTYHQWHGHVSCCEQCRARRSCHVAYGYRVLHLHAARAVGKPAPLCVACQQEVGATELMEPHIWDGDAALRIGYVHVLCAARGGAS